MKYFTKEWWGSGAEGIDGVFERYEAYFTSISPRLPAALVELHRQFTLHDARVARCVTSTERRTLQLLLHGWDRGFQNRLAYTLNFQGLSHFEQVFPVGNGHQEIGDLGYWEVEERPEGIEMRMLFASDAEFTVLFSGLELVVEHPEGAE